MNATGRIDDEEPDRPGRVTEYGVEISEQEFNNRCGEKP